MKSRNPIKIKALVKLYRTEFKKLPESVLAGPSVKSIEEVFLTSWLNDVLDSLEVMDVDATEESLKPLTNVLKQAYRFNKTSNIFIKCHKIAEKLASQVFVGKKIVDLLDLSKIDLATTDFLLVDALEARDPNEWAKIVETINSQQFTNLFLNLGDNFKYDQLRKALELFMVTKTNYSPNNLKYNLALIYCIYEIYRIHREKEPDNMTTTGWMFNYPNRAEKLDFCEKMKLACIKGDDSVFELLDSPHRAGNDGFMLAHRNFVKANPELFPRLVVESKNTLAA